MHRSRLPQNFCYFLVCLAWLTWVVDVGVVAARAQMHNGVELVQADLLADTGAIVPGKPFTVGLRLKMAAHWHTYWQYPGDAGLATTIQWQLPPGFRAGPIQWPLPEKIESPGDIVNYGYSDEVVLLTEVTPPAQISEKELTLKAKAEWLVCAELCVPGDGNLELKLPVGDGHGADAANAEIFAQYRARLPQPFDRAKAGFDFTRVMEANDLVLRLVDVQSAAGQQRVEFFPVPPEPTVEVGHAVVEKGGDLNGVARLDVRLPILSGIEKAAGIGGVLVVSAPGKRIDGNWDARVGWIVPSNPVSTAAGSNDGMETPPARAVATPSGAAARDGTGGSLWSFLFLSFFGAMVLNVMPCVLPAISLKIFGFIQQADEEPARIWRLGLAYVAGIFAWFLGFAVLVIALKAAGREVGYSFQFQNVWFVLVVCAVVFVLALNLLGVFEVVLPGSVNDAAAGAASRKGYGGAFFQGLLATVLASACTAPFFGAAIGFAFAQNAAVILAMFAVIALGMGLPFLVLTRFPAWLRYLPRPGAWMERVKQVNGFLLLATVIWLLSVVGALRGADAIVWTSAFLLTLGVACWVQGAFNTFTASAAGRWKARAVIALLVLGGGAWTLAQVAQARREEGVAGLANATNAAGGQRAKFSEQLTAALKENRPVFVDFTAAWCVNCKVNERAVLATEPVQRALREKNAIFLTADWTDGAEDITKLLRGFGRAGVPLYVVYPAGKPDAPIVLPELLTQRLVLDALDAAAAKPLAATAEN
ncbi:MAG: thioredoxin family protein [Verrucomicrobia bacterium]|nr:thioredoxin family protein [Verrucomicrobiota bacterium]